MTLPATMTWGPFRGQPIAAMTEAYLTAIVWSAPLPDDLRMAIELELYLRWERAGLFDDIAHSTLRN